MRSFFVVISIVLIVLTVIFGTISWYKGYQYGIACGQHLERAASANSISLAKQELDISIGYLEKNDLTSGNTSVFFLNQQNDIGFWYKNLKASQAELEIAVSTKNISFMESSNILLKLHESLMIHGEKGQYVRSPSNIALYPNVFYWSFGVGILTVCTMISLVLTASSSDN